MTSSVHPDTMRRTQAAHINQPTIPSGMIEVSKDRFFELLYADKRDIMPSHQARDFTSWEVVHTRVQWGWSTPGWANAGMFPKQYAVRATAAA